MKPQRIKLTKSQMIDGEWSTTEALCLGEALTEDMSRLRFQNDDEDLLLTFGPQEVAYQNVYFRWVLSSPLETSPNDNRTLCPTRLRD